MSGRLGTRTFTSLSVIVSGYAPSRSLQRMEVQFVPREGATIEGTQFTVDVTAEARQWFSSVVSQTVGGQFSVEVPFTFSVGATPAVPEDLVGRIEAIQVTVTNELGTSNRISIPVQ